DRARGRTGAAARKHRKFARLKMQSQCAIGGRGQRRETGGRRSQPRAGRKIVAGFDVRAGRDARTRSEQVEECADLAALRFVGLAIQGDVVGGERVIEAHTRARVQRVQRDRQRARGRQVQRGVALAPVLDQRDVRLCLCGGLQGSRGHRRYPLCSNHCIASASASRAGRARQPSSVSARWLEKYIRWRASFTPSTVIFGTTPVKRAQASATWATGSTTACGNCSLGAWRPVSSETAASIAFRLMFSPTST